MKKRFTVTAIHANAAEVGWPEYEGKPAFRYCSDDGEWAWVPDPMVNGKQFQVGDTFLD